MNANLSCREIIFSSHLIDRYPNEDSSLPPSPLAVPVKAIVDGNLSQGHSSLPWNTYNCAGSLSAVVGCSCSVRHPASSTAGVLAKLRQAVGSCCPWVTGYQSRSELFAIDSIGMIVDARTRHYLTVSATMYSSNNPLMGGMIVRPRRNLSLSFVYNRLQG